MRIIFSILLLAACCSAAQGPDCKIPEPRLVYPALAKAARVDGVVTATIASNSDGSINVLDVTGHPMIRMTTRDALLNLKLPNECSGQQLTFEVTYRIGEYSRNGAADDEVQRVGPTKYVVVGHPIIISDPPACIEKKQGFWRIFLGLPVRRSGCQ
jgi:hypothetical protein